MFVPPVPARMGECQLTYYQYHQHGLLRDLIKKKIADNQRILYLDEWAIAFVPVCARYPYEVWIAPIQPVATLYRFPPWTIWAALYKRSQRGLEESVWRW